MFHFRRHIWLSSYDTSPVIRIRSSSWRIERATSELIKNNSDEYRTDILYCTATLFQQCDQVLNTTLFRCGIQYKCSNNQRFFSKNPTETHRHDFKNSKPNALNNFQPVSTFPLFPVMVCFWRDILFHLAPVENKPSILASMIFVSDYAKFLVESQGWICPSILGSHNWPWDDNMSTTVLVQQIWKVCFRTI